MPVQPDVLILASRSPRRKKLLLHAGYRVKVRPARDKAECGICSRETPPELVGRLAWQKAQDVARDMPLGVVIGCDTVATCHGQILGKPADREHARHMLTLLRGRPHEVYSGLCLWRRPDDYTLLEVEVTRLRMDDISDTQMEDYLDSGQWQDKAGAFGYQDGLDWVHIVAGSESNVVGLPMELLDRMLRGLVP